jgi:hypothetical protein
MITRHSLIRTRAGIVPAAVVWLCLGSAMAPLSARAAGVFLPGAPSGFTTALPAAPPSGFGTTTGAGADNVTGDLSDGGIGALLLDGLSMNANFSGIYNSNVAANQTTTDSGPKDDFILSLGGNLNYLSKSSALTFGGNYRGNYNQYFNHSEYSGYTQGGSLVANYEGARLSVSGMVSMSIDRGSNSNYSSAFVEQTSINTQLSARYRISPKTSLAGSFGQHFTTASGNYSDTTSYDFNLSALWRYSALTEFGPGIRYSYDTGSTQLGRSSIGPTLTVNYKLSQKVALNSRIGVDFASYDNGGSADPSMSASIGLNYQASQLWGLNLSLYRDTQADPNYAGDFTEVTSLHVGYHRNIRRATWNVGTTYQTNTSTNSGSSGGGGRPDQDYFSFDTSLGMPLFSNSTYASVFLQFNEQSGSGNTNSWNSFQAGFSLSRSF